MIIPARPLATTTNVPRWWSWFVGVLGLATGGFWLFRFFTGARLADANRIVLLVALLVFSVPFLVPAWSQLRAGRRSLLRRIHDAVVDHPWRTAGVVVVSWFLTHAFLAATLVRSHYGYDMIFVVQAAHNAVGGPAPLWKTVEGHGSYFTHHFIPYLYLFWPLAHLPLAAAWFCAVQDIANAVFLAWAILCIRAEVRSRIVRLALVGALIACPFWTGVIHYEFHEYGFAPLLGLALWRAWVRRSWWAWPLACVGLLMLKETLALDLAWIGLLLLIWGAWTRQIFTTVAGAMALGLAGAALGVYYDILLPAYAGVGSFRFNGYYQHLGGSMTEVALSPLHRPSVFFASLADPANGRWLMTWVAAVGVVGVLGWAWWLFLGPEIAVVVLASYPTIKATIYQYGGPFMPVFLLSLLAAGRFFEGRRRQRGPLLLGALVAVTLVSTWEVPDRLRALVSPLGFPSIPFVLRQRGDDRAATNSAAGAMHLAARRDLEVRFLLPSNPPDTPILVVDGQAERYLIDERLPYRITVPVVEVDRCGPYLVVIPQPVAHP